VVPCASNVCGIVCANVVTVTLDAAGVFRPRPAFCEACRAELAANALSFREALSRVPRITADDLQPWMPPDVAEEAR
jgi:hypothetical protein